MGDSRIVGRGDLEEGDELMRLTAVNKSGDAALKCARGRLGLCRADRQTARHDLTTSRGGQDWK